MAFPCPLRHTKRPKLSSCRVTRQISSASSGCRSGTTTIVPLTPWPSARSPTAGRGFTPVGRCLLRTMSNSVLSLPSPVEASFSDGHQDITVLAAGLDCIPVSRREMERVARSRRWMRLPQDGALAARWRDGTVAQGPRCPCTAGLQGRYSETYRSGIDLQEVDGAAETGCMSASRYHPDANSKSLTS